jgi:hypothetical protein
LLLAKQGLDKPYERSIKKTLGLNDFSLGKLRELIINGPGAFFEIKRKLQKLTRLKSI